MKPCSVALFVLVGCGAVPDIEGKQTITQGVYGQALYTCDTEDCDAKPARGLEVVLFEDDRVTESGRAFVDADGLFEIAHAPGLVVVCDGYRPEPSTLTDPYQSGPCQRLEVPTGTVRTDYHAGLERQWLTPDLVRRSQD